MTMNPYGLTLIKLCRTLGKDKYVAMGDVLNFK